MTDADIYRKAAESQYSRKGPPMSRRSLFIFVDYFGILIFQRNKEQRVLALLLMAAISESP